MGFLEIFGFGRKTKSNKENIISSENNAEENIMPADTPFPSGIEKGDEVKIKYPCREYRDDKWNACTVDSSSDIYFKKHYDHIVFKAINCKGGNYIELFAEENNKTYDIYVKSDMIERYYQPIPVNYNNNNNNNSTSINKGNIIPVDSPFPSGIKKGDKVKIRDICREYRDDKWNVCSIDLSQDIYFKKNYDNIVFEAISCKGENYIELLAEENNKTYDIYVKSDMIESIENQSPQSSDTSNYNNYNNYIDEDYEQNNNYDIDNSDYNTDEDFIDIDEYNYCNVESIDEWCKNTDYDDGGYSWTNDYYQEFFDDEDMLDEFSSKKLCSMMYDDIYLPNSIKEKAFRRLINRANNGNAAAQYWFGVTAYEGLAGREPDKQIAYIYISLAESNGFRVSSGYREWLKNPTSEYIAERFDVNTSLNYDESDLITDNDNYDYNDDDDYNDYDDDDYDNDYEYDSYYSYSNSNSICNGDNVRINSGVNRYWTDIYNKNTRINGIPSDYYNRIWKVINNDGNKFLLESTTGKFFSKSTVRIVLAKNDISKA